MNSLFQEPVASLLASLHQQASQQAFPGFRLGPGEQLADLNYRDVYHQLEHCYLAVDPELGRLLYTLVRSSRPRLVVEFGTSFGLSTIYLAAALRDNGSGRLVSAEFVPAKAEQAERNLEAAGLKELVEIRSGDALETLKGLEADFVLLDGAKNLYLPVLRQLKLRPAALVLADNIKMVELLGDYLEYVRNPANLFTSTRLGDTELSLYR